MSTEQSTHAPLRLVEDTGASISPRPTADFRAEIDVLRGYAADLERTISLLPVESRWRDTLRTDLLIMHGAVGRPRVQVVPEEAI